MGRNCMLFAEFADRKKSEQAESDADSEQREQLRIVMATAIESVVLPVLNEDAREIKSEGHASVVEHSYQEPVFASICFRPRIGLDEGAPILAPKSMLHFEAKSAVFSIWEETWAHEDDEEPKRSIHATCEVGSLNQEFIRQQVNSFIEGVLKRN